MSFPTEKEMQVILDQEIEKLDFGEKGHIAPLLVPIHSKTLKWEYGNDEQFPAWVVADLQERGVGVAYCKGGHGASGDTWGLIFFHDDYFGMDAGWYSSLKELIQDGWYPNT